MEEQAKTLDLEARIVGAKRALRRAKREDAEEEAALVEVEEAPRRAREARERQIEQADARRKEVEFWVGHGELFVPEGAPETLTAEFKTRVEEKLAPPFDLYNKSQEAMDGLLGRIAREVFADWQREQKAKAEAARLAEQDKARAARDRRQRALAWDLLCWKWTAYVGGPRDDHVLHSALEGAIDVELARLPLGAPQNAEEAARERAVEHVLLPFKSAKEKERLEAGHRRTCERVADWAVAGRGFAPERSETAAQAVREALAKLPVGCGQQALDAARDVALKPFVAAEAEARAARQAQRAEAQQQAEAAAAAKNYLGVWSYVDDYLRELANDEDGRWAWDSNSDRLRDAAVIKKALTADLTQEFLTGSLDPQDREAVHDWIERKVERWLRENEEEEEEGQEEQEEEEE